MDVAGSVEVSAWERPEVEITGSVDDAVERVEVTSAADRTSINVVMRSGLSRHGGETLADLALSSTAQLEGESVSGGIRNCFGPAPVKAQSGDVRLCTQAAK